MNKDFSKLFIETLRSSTEGQDVLKMIGDVFLSSWETMKKGDIYVLGFNPGGEAEGYSIEDSLKSTEHSNWSALDVQWRGSAPGEHKYQLGAKKYLKCLGLTSSPAISNVLFLKDKTVANLGSRTKYLDACWAVHEEALKIIQPKMILCLGNGERANQSSYAYVRERLPKSASQHEKRDLEGRVKWFKGRLFEPPHHFPVLVIGVRHPSRFAPSKEVLARVSSLYRNA